VWLLGRAAEGTGDVEVWLDAALAADRERLSHRALALVRSLAARLRGDEARAAEWLARAKGVAQVREAARPELGRVLRL
jgi:hypothetical protein